MIQQPIPTYCDDDVERVVKRDFRASELTKVKDLLKSYPIESRQAEPRRIWMACLKIADGNLEKLNRYLQQAYKDYRDVLVLAEYPRYMLAKGPEQKRQAMEKDWQELQTWVKKI